MVHNAMNEDTWRRVAQWEKLHEYTKGEPMLLRFRGRPDELSPLGVGAR
jgi:cytochrome c heme-lyase